MDSLEDFKNITVRILQYLPEVISFVEETQNYKIIKSISGNSEKYSRPYNKKLYINNPEDFIKKYNAFLDILKRVAQKEKDFPPKDYLTLDCVVYTIQQSLGIALDLLGNQNANRKHVGNRFEELIRLIVSEINIQNKKVILKIPYGKDEIYSCETDFVFSPFTEVRSNNSIIDKNEVVVSLKTSSKDRMGKIFIDKILMSRFVGHEIKVIGIFFNDVQRKEQKNISYTFVAGLFMVYTKFLTTLEGVYFIDPPPNTLKKPLNEYIKRFSDFLLRDARELLANAT